MRILLTADPLIPVPPVGYGGIERIIDALVRGLTERGHEVALVAHPDSRNVRGGLFPWPDLRMGGINATCRQAAHLRRIHRSLQPDVLHSFSRLGLLIPVLVGSGKAIMSYQRHTGGSGVRIAAAIGGRNLRFSGCSEFICAMGRRAGGRWTSIPNFVELPSYRAQNHVGPDAPLVFLSRLDRIKGPDTAIRIARRAGRRLILAGNAPSDPEGRHYFEETLAPHFGHNGIEWVGEVNDLQKSDLLSQAAALLLPIRWNEPFGIVFAEALACGTPILTCPRGAAPEIVQPGRNGFLFDNEEDGIAAVQKLETIDRSTCRADAEARFGADRAIDRYLELYREVTHGA